MKRNMPEKKRGCGYRKVGAMYLVGSGIAVGCDRLPYELTTCPVCGAGVKQSRGFTWLDWFEFAGKHEDCKDKYLCPLCNPKEGDTFGLMWVGKRHYTPESFVEEAIKMGVSKRIAQIPNKLELGKTRILVAHPDAVTNICPRYNNPVSWYNNPPEPWNISCDTCRWEECEVRSKPTAPGIFYSFIAQRVEKLITKEQSEDKETIEKLKKRGITPVVYEKPEEEP